MDVQVKHPHFFGYGSLVNRRTHSHESAGVLTIRGWQRAWVTAPGRDVSFLSVIQEEGGHITGLAALVENADWAALDTREASYERCAIAPADIIDGPIISDLAIYAVPEAQLKQPSPEAPVLLSYIDVVFQGYLQETGTKGLSDFITSTKGWDAPIKNDRASPIYPRAQRISQSEARVIDDALQSLNVQIF